MTWARRGTVLLVIVAGLIWCGRPADAHSGLRFSSPLDGATLGDSPTLVQLTFVEKPEPSLATIRVEDTSGNPYHADRPEPVNGDPLSLAVRLRPLGRGVYTVRWRVVSAVDGHASAGVFVFGVLVDPSGAVVTAAAEARAPVLEVLARTILLGGLMVALGAATASVLRFGSERDAAVAGLGWFASIAGLALLAGAQSRVAGVELLELSGTAIGRALGWRLVALVVAGCGILLAVVARRAGRLQAARAGSALAALATLAAMVAHATAGHASAGRWPVMPTVAFQVIHFGAAGIWIGGLAALLAGLRGGATDARAKSIRRFSTVAAAGLVLVTASGLVRSLQEVSAWADLTATAYGIVVMGKLALLAIIVVLASFNRWRSVPAAATSLGPLRKVGSIELTVAMVAVVAAALLGALPPPASTQAIAGIEASGSDFGTTVRARLSAASDQPGPNRFVVQLRDYDSAAPMTADRASLRFTPLDDPGVTATQLSLAAGPEGSYVGSGANLSFAGRWRIQVLIERAGSSVEVPLEVEARQPGQFVSVLRPPGSPATYTIEVAGLGFVNVVVTSERPGPATLQVSCLNVIYEPLAINQIVLTSGAAPTLQLPVTRISGNQFTAEVDLAPGENRLAVVARTESGTRLRAVLTVEVRQR